MNAWIALFGTGRGLRPAALAIGLICAAGCSGRPTDAAREILAEPGKRWERMRECRERQLRSGMDECEGVPAKPEALDGENDRW